MSLQERCQTEHYFVGALIDDRYHLTEFLGAGGMACVYRAQEPGSPHHYAIKFLKGEYHNQPYLIDFFRDEASSMRDLAHPNIVRFYRFINNEFYSYIVMEYVDGFTLADVIKRVQRQNRNIPLDEAVRIIIQVARALDAIHREGFVHRDVKPSNVLIERGTGQTFLTDLGITTTTNTRMEGAGTLAYMPPEMFETWVADQRADVYSFGILIYEILTKERPFNVNPDLHGHEAEMDILRKHKEQPVPDASAARRGLPKEADAIIHRALAKIPEERYSNILEVVQDLHAVLKPKLSDDMQDIATITHRHVVAPDSLAAAAGFQNQRVFMALLGLSIVAIIIMGGLIAFGVTNPSPTATPIPTITPTPHPLQNQADFTLVSGNAAIPALDLTDGLIISPVEDTALRFLGVGVVDGFRVRMTISDSSTTTRFGLAFRVQDAQNYYLFSVEPDSGAWEFSTIVDGQVQGEPEQGVFDALPQTITIAGIGDFFRVVTQNETLTLTASHYQQGSLALYIEGEELGLETLTIALVGEEADRAKATTPTPAPGLGDPLLFIHRDLIAMRETDIVARSAVNCPIFIPLHEAIVRYTESADQTIQALAERAEATGKDIYLTCLDSPDVPHSFANDFELYSRWERELHEILLDVDAG